MNRTCLALIFASSTIVPAASAAAAVTVFNADLSGLQENPVNASPGSGFVTVTVDDILFTMRVEASFADLAGTTVAAHIHCCEPPPENATVATQTPSFIGFPLGVTSGTYDSTFDMMLASSYRAGFITDHGGTVESAFDALLAGMFAGESYFNIHTTSFSGGEIRGQLQAVPEPSTWGMMLLGFGAAGLAFRRRRARQLANATR
jgi:hypothetical protein